ncbi:MAG: hypothetical protein AAGG01_24565 [Planctomycetota bacterium]
MAGQHPRNSDSNRHSKDHEPPAHERLRGSVHDLFSHVAPPEALRDQLIAAAEERVAAAASPRQGRLLRLWRPSAAAAAAALLLLLSRDSARYAPYDLDRSGAVDAYDAYLMAQLAQEAGSFPDVNGDARRTRDDADALLRQIVTLPAENPR